MIFFHLKEFTAPFAIFNFERFKLFSSEEKHTNDNLNNFFFFSNTCSFKIIAQGNGGNVTVR